MNNSYLKKIFVFGDIHGCINPLQKLLEYIKFSSNDLLIFLGDYIDRGENSKEVLDCLMELSTITNIIPLMGNHEHYFLEMIENIELNSIYTNVYIDNFIFNGGMKTLESFNINNKYITDNQFLSIPEKYINFIKSMKLYHELDEYILVHAGINPFLKDVKNNTVETLLYSRQLFINVKSDLNKKIIYGHTPHFQYPKITNNYIGIDTGIVFNSYLTCFELSEQMFYQINNNNNFNKFHISSGVI